MQSYWNMHSIPTDSVIVTIISSYIQGITTPHIRHKLRTAKANRLEDIFTLALEKDQKWKVRALDFDTKPDTIAHCDINVIKSTCYKCGKQGHFIKDCPQNQQQSYSHHTQKYLLQVTSHKISTQSITPDAFATITQTLNNLVDQIKQMSTNTTNTPKLSSHKNTYHRQTGKFITIGDTMDTIQISIEKNITIETKDTMANIAIMVTSHIRGTIDVTIKCNTQSP